MSIIAELRKKFWVRLKLALAFIIVFLLADEGIKEGYIFKLSEVLQPLTHERWVVIISILLAAVMLIERGIKTWMKG